MAAKKQPEVAYVEANFEGVATAEDGGPKPGVSIDDIASEFSEGLIAYLSKQQQRISELEYELSRK